MNTDSVQIQERIQIQMNFIQEWARIHARIQT